jgi:hypothetical protein
VARHIHIVVNCSERKRLPAKERSCVRNLPRWSLKKRLDLWVKRIQNTSGTELPARDMYLGDHWQVARGLPDLAVKRGWTADLWICSAGLGLVHADSVISSYSATFSPGQEDSVVSAEEGAEGTRSWWNGLGRNLSKAFAHPRSLAELGRGLRSAVILVVGSPSYVDAMADDLTAARESLARSSQLLLISSQPGPREPQLKNCWIPSSASLQGLLGGALNSLNGRVARYLLSHVEPSDFGGDRLQMVIATLRKRAPPRLSYEPLRRSFGLAFRRIPGRPTRDCFD